MFSQRVGLAPASARERESRTQRRRRRFREMRDWCLDMRGGGPKITREVLLMHRPPPVAMTPVAARTATTVLSTTEEAAYLTQRIVGIMRDEHRCEILDRSAVQEMIDLSIAGSMSMLSQVIRGVVQDSGLLTSSDLNVFVARIAELEKELASLRQSEQRMVCKKVHFTTTQVPVEHLDLIHRDIGRLNRRLRRTGVQVRRRSSCRTRSPSWTGELNSCRVPARRFPSCLRRSARWSGVCSSCRMIGTPTGTTRTSWTHSASRYVQACRFTWTH